MDMKKIIIWCSPGTGSSLLSQMLSACGMNLGDKQTYYDSGSNAEHSLINSLHGEITTGNKVTEPSSLVDKYNSLPGNDPKEKYRTVLRSYMRMAKEKNWQCFGIKTTTGHNPSVFFDLMRIQEEEWGKDIHYFLTVRHPIASLKRLQKHNRPDGKNPEKVYEQWASHLPLKFALISKGATAVRFPEHFQNGVIKKIISDSGLKWTDQAANLFNPSQFSTVGQEETEGFSNSRPGLSKAYEILAESCPYE